MKKVLISLFLLTVASFTVQAQEEVSYKSKIKLKDGSELRVVIIENVPEKYVRIKLPGNETATINYADILSIKHKDYVYEQNFDLPKGLYFEGTTALLFGRSSEYTKRVGIILGVTASYRFYPGLSLGLGVEPTMASNFLLMPIYARISGDFKEKRQGLTYFVDAGWSLARNTDIYYETVRTAGGWFLRPGLGLRLNQFTLTVAYQVQKVTTTSQNPVSQWALEQVLVEERVMRNVVLGVRLAF